MTDSARIYSSQYDPRPQAEDALACLLPKVASGAISPVETFAVLRAMDTLERQSVECPDGRVLTRADVRMVNAEAGIRERYGLTASNLADRAGCRVRAHDGSRLALVLAPPPTPDPEVRIDRRDFEGRIEIHVEREENVFEHVATADARCLRELVTALCRKAAQP